MEKEKLVVPFDMGNATVNFSDEDAVNIVITSNGIKYEFEANPVGIVSNQIDGRKRTEYKRIMEK